MKAWNKLYYGRYMRGIYTEKEFIDAVNIANEDNTKFCVIMTYNNKELHKELFREEVVMSKDHNLSIEEAVMRRNLYAKRNKDCCFDVAREEQ